MPGTIAAALDAKLQYIITNAATLHLSSASPASIVLGAAVSGSLGSVAVDSGDYAIADGTATGDRKFTQAEQEIITDPAGGNILSIQIANAAGEAIHFWDATLRALNGSTAYTVPVLVYNDKAPVNI